MTHHESALRHAAVLLSAGLSTTCGEQTQTLLAVLRNVVPGICLVVVRRVRVLHPHVYTG